LQKISLQLSPPTSQSVVERPLSPLAPADSHEMALRGWDSVDIIFVTGDAYIDHPSFAAGILVRSLEAAGFKVAVLSQPDWKSCEPWRQFGKPRLFFAISAGNMDSMINHYTANRKVRNDDAYSPGGKIGLRPDRATLVYCQRAREAFPGIPVIAGGVEASLRRLAHYDYWSDSVKRSILLDSKADIVVYGMGELPIVEIAKRLDQGETVTQLRDMRGVAFALGAKETPSKDLPQTTVLSQIASKIFVREASGPRPVVLEFVPSFEQVKSDKMAFVHATRAIHSNTNPFNAKTLVQYHGDQAIICQPPTLPLDTPQMDRHYGLPFTRRPHPKYTEPIPAFEMIKDSVTIMRGCFGGCTFCSITAHQGRVIQSRSEESILGELKTIAADPEFKGTISDIGGPTANMYRMRCTRPEVEAKCHRLSCVHPTVCKLMGTDHNPLIQLMRKSREQKGIKKVLIASGVRMDLAQLSPDYLEELATHHVGGHLKVAPEAVDPHVLDLMKKPRNVNFLGFAKAFKQASMRAGKPKQYLVPYFISSHPGSDIHAMIDLAVFLKKNGYRPDQVQDFIPAPYDLATCMYYTGIDPMSLKEVNISKKLKDRQMQRALLQFFKPENWFEVRDALIQAGRVDLIGGGCDALIPAKPPEQALKKRMEKSAQESNKSPIKGDHYHRVPNPANNTQSKSPPKPKGYRPGRATATRGNKPGRNSGKGPIQP